MLICFDYDDVKTIWKKLIAIQCRLERIQKAFNDDREINGLITGSLTNLTEILEIIEKHYHSGRNV